MTLRLLRHGRAGLRLAPQRQKNTNNAQLVQENGFNPVFQSAALRTLSQAHHHAVLGRGDGLPL